MEFELNPVEFITIGTVGPKGQRIFHLQAGSKTDIVTLTIEKEQASALSEAIRELLQDLDRRFPPKTETPTGENMNMELREPIDPKFRVARMGLGYDEDRDMVVLVAQELLVSTSSAVLAEEEDEEADDAFDPFDELFSTDDEGSDDGDEPGIVRLWCNREQMRALSTHSMNTVQSGRPDPKLNGRLVYYWT
jgi:uncharacterized repeat protein (TIGR03847 family)